jgi:hypothetical protein
VTQQKFAAITSNLLARKGDARPWQAPSYEPRRLVINSATRSDIGTHANSEPKPSAPETTPPRPQVERTRRFSLLLSPEEFKSLGIAAVKRGVSRQQLLRAAIESYLGDTADTLSGRCDCLSTSFCEPANSLEPTR